MYVHRYHITFKGDIAIWEGLKAYVPHVCTVLETALSVSCMFSSAGPLAVARAY
jgi:hypothetical protein